MLPKQLTVVSGISYKGVMKVVEQRQYKRPTDDEIIQSITDDEIAALSGKPSDARAAWIVRRHGSADEKKRATRGDYPRWAYAVAKKFRREVKK